MPQEHDMTGSQDADSPDILVQAELVDDKSESPPIRSPFKPSYQTKIDRSEHQPPVTWREILAILLLIVVSDLTIYRGHGFAGLALLFALAPALLLLGSFRPFCGRKTWFVGFMLLALGAKMLWCGSELGVVVGFGVLAAFATCIAGQTPFVFEVILHAANTVRAGFDGLSHYGRGMRFPFARVPWLNVLLPLAAFVVFGMIFILANPDLLHSFSEAVESFFVRLRDWLIHFSLFEITFWVAVLWISIGWLRPGLNRQDESAGKSGAAGDNIVHAPALLYSAVRNTLVTVIVLFAIYLMFEFKTLWFREFPKGFYYSGYAHEGAAWLTFALALSTIVLSLIFRGAVLFDPRLAQLRNLAWIWSVQNLVLAMAVYNRMFIYVDFNGMTRMRMVGLFGITTVLVGFIFVIRKIAADRSFVWLLRRHLWTLALAIYLFALTPVDAIVVSYNVRRILAGDPAPSVEISVHPINSEGVLLLQPLLDCEDEIIREGVRAMLAGRDAEAEQLAAKRIADGWTAFQIADRIVLDEFRSNRSKWSEYALDAQKRQSTLDRFHEYAYQWY